MSREFRSYDVVVPTGTTKTAPHKAQLAMPPRIVRSVWVFVPAGPHGQMGFQIGNAKQQVIPINAGAWIYWTDIRQQFTLTDFSDAGTWWLIAYNLGTYTHTVYLEFACTLPTGITQTAPTVPIATGTLGGFVPVGTVPVVTAPRTPVTPTPVTIPTVPIATVPIVTVPTVPTLTPVTIPPITIPTVPTVGTLTPVTIPPITIPTVATPGTLTTLTLTLTLTTLTTPTTPTLIASWVVAPNSQVRTYEGTKYYPISTYSLALSMASKPTTVFLWTTMQNRPSKGMTPTKLRTIEHTGNHAYTQFVTYSLTATSVPAPPKLLGQWVIAPTPTPHVYQGTRYEVIDNYATAVRLAATPDTVYLWTRTNNIPSLPQTQASLRAWEHTGNHAYTQYVTYRRV